MVLSPWLTLRQAKEALRGGRPDEAHRLLAPLAAEGYRKAVNLTLDVAKGYVARGERHLRADNPEAAWIDLLSAESLNAADAGAIKLRHILSKFGLAVCRAALEAGHPVHVIDTAARLTDRSVSGPELDRLVAAAQQWVQASEQADRGDFPLAKDTLARTKATTDPYLTPGMDKFARELDRRNERFRAAVAELETAAEARQWKDAVRWADEATAAAPDAREVRSLRAKAWAALQPGSDAGSPVEEPILLAAGVLGSAYAPTKAGPLPIARPSTRPPTMAAPPGGSARLPKRFLLWVDHVGGYLVCLNPRVTFGQAIADGPVDVPLFAELSRLHAEIYRDGEGYILESTRDVLVNGLLAPRSVLRPGDRLTLGTSCQLTFHQPVPISPSARLELVSGHRLPLAVDGVLLMAEALILGPGEQVHVPLPEGAKGNVVLYRSKDGLGVRCPGEFRVDNKPCKDRCELPLPSVVTAEGFTFALEPVGPRL